MYIVYQLLRIYETRSLIIRNFVETFTPTYFSTICVGKVIFDCTLAYTTNLKISKLRFKNSGK